MAAHLWPATPLSLTTPVGPMSNIFKTKHTLSCEICGMKYQLFDNTEVFREATASDGDLAELLNDWLTLKKID